MKMWIIATIVMALIVIGAVAITTMNVATADTAKTDTTAKSCGSCNGQCSANNNCGLATCGAVSGSGSCGCGKK